MTSPQQTGNSVTGAIAQLALDFLSTILFLVIFAVTGNVIIATAVAIAGGIAQFAWSRYKGKPLDLMSGASLALVVVLGGTTLWLNDPRFVLMKPSIGHFAIGAIMLRPGWLLRYLPPVVTETIPDLVRSAGYAWAALMFAIGLGNIAVAWTGDLKLWAVYVSVIAVGAKIAAFAIQYLVFRAVITHRKRAAAVAVNPSITNS